MPQVTRKEQRFKIQDYVIISSEKLNTWLNIYHTTVDNICHTTVDNIYHITVDSIYHTTVDSIYHITVDSIHHTTVDSIIAEVIVLPLHRFRNLAMLARWRSVWVDRDRVSLGG